MADPIYELLVPYFDPPSPRPSPTDPITRGYINRLTTLPLSSLTTTEPESLQQTTHSLLLSLQSLSKRSHKSIIDSSTHLSTLSNTLPALAHSTASLRDALPKLDSAALHFSETYNHRSSHPSLDRRRKALLLSRNIDRLSDILDLPTLLSTAISSSSNTTSSTSTTTSSSSTTPTNNLNYTTALDLSAHIRRLHTLYPTSPLLTAVSQQADAAMQTMTVALITSLRAPSLKLAQAMRTISFLRRVAPELSSPPISSSTSTSTAIQSSSIPSPALPALFLISRLSTLALTLEALSPLRDLADQETVRLRLSHENLTNPATKGGGGGAGGKWESGQQTERYLKRYIEIFREQSFAIISMYRSIFPASPHAPAASLPTSTSSTGITKEEEDPLALLPSPLSTFPLQLVEMLTETLRRYLPNVREKSGRDSLLTQVLYCAGSLGRLGGDFGGVLEGLASGEKRGGRGENGGDGKVGKAGNGEEGEEEEEEDEDESEDDAEEWAEVIKKHRVLAGRLESMVGAREG